MTTVQLTFRHAPRLVLGLGVLLGIVGCGDLDDDEAASDEVTGAIANGRPGGGVGVVRLQLWNGRVLSNGKLDDVICTGTVISGDRILTAGHCVNKWLTIKDGNDSTVLLQGDLFAGAEYTTDGTNWFCLQDKTQAHCSPSVLAPVHVTRLGNGELPPDVAVIRFATPFQGIKSSHFRQLSIAEPRARQSVEVWGIGFTDPSGTGRKHDQRDDESRHAHRLRQRQDGQDRQLARAALPRRFGWSPVRRPERLDHQHGVAGAAQERRV